MKKAELSKLAKDGEWEKIIAELFSGAPYAFQKRPSEYGKAIAHLSTALNVKAESITLVGSGRFGFSLAPYKFGRPFNDRSDLDFIIVDAAFFDTAWMELIRYDFNSLPFDRDVSESIREHRSNNVFWGYLEPYNLKVALSVYRKVWFPAFAGLGFFVVLAGRQVKARVYRTWDHAKTYHRFGLRMLVAQDTGEKK